MTYKETITYLFSQLPMYQKVGELALKKDLANIRSLCKYLDNPQSEFKSIHIAGTNGKGSVSHYIASILQEAGYSVGLYTSPHYKDFRERIKINGHYIKKKEVVEFIERISPDLENTKASFFELSVAMAFDHFAKKKVDYAVIETGLGGRLDSTNILRPVLSVITNISYDHQSILGESLSEIASEKAGIIKKSTPVLIGKWQEQISGVFKKKAEKEGAKLLYAQKDSNMEFEKSSGNVSIKPSELQVGLKEDEIGPYQIENIQTATKTIELINEIELLSISELHIQNGIEKVRTNTNFIGRWEVISDHPRIIADSAHNEAGLKSVFQKISRINYGKLHVVLGMVKDKKIDSFIHMFPRNARYYFAKAKIPRGMEANTLMEIFHSHGLKGKSYVSVKNALKAAKRAANSEDLIYIGGSIFTVAEIL